MKKVLFILLLLPAFGHGQIFYPGGAVDSTTFTFSTSDSLIHHLPNSFCGCPSTSLQIETLAATLWQIGYSLKPVFSNDTTPVRGLMTDTLHSYPPNANDYFTLGMDHVLPNFIIDVWHKFEMDSMHAGGFIEYSTDTGLTWMNIGNCTDIRKENMYSATDTLITGVPAFTGNSHGEILSRFQFINCWEIRTTVTSCLTEGNVFDGAPFYLRFRFVSDSTVDSLSGWMIDSIKIEDPGCIPPSLISEVNNLTLLNIFPNPANDRVTISAKTIITSVSIANLLGQTVYSDQCNSTEAQIDVSRLPSGLYFVKINGVEVRKFLKE